MALFAGLIGLGFGALNAADEYWLPAISPLLSSLAVLLGLGLLGLLDHLLHGLLGLLDLSNQWADLGGLLLRHVFLLRKTLGTGFLPRAQGLSNRVITKTPNATLPVATTFFPL
jgi:peptidoglycan biosynthesis protein MviN/MurJ (putative lipid II flippase)